MTVLQDLLKDQGITDPEDYLSQVESKAKLGFSDFQEVSPRGSVHLMLRKVIRRDDVERRLADAKFF